MTIDYEELLMENEDEIEKLEIENKYWKTISFILSFISAFFITMYIFG